MAVRCKVKTNLWPTGATLPVTESRSAQAYTKSVGWDHVSFGLCTNKKCRDAKRFIDYGLISLGPKGIINTNKYMSLWSLEFKISQGSIKPIGE